MSGPESRPEPDDPRVEGRPLSPDVHAGHARSRPQHDPDEAGHESDPDRDRGEEDEGHRPSRRRPRRGFTIPPLAPTLGLIASYPRRRRERAASEPRANGDRPASRFSPLAWKPEARVGVAAVLSFVLIVGVLAFRRGWLGGTNAPTASIRNQAADKPKVPAAAPTVAARPVDPAPRAPADPAPSGGLRVQGSKPVEPRRPPSIDPDGLPPIMIAQNDPPVGEPKATPAGATESPPAPGAGEKTPDPLELPGPSSPTPPAGDPAPIPPAPAEARPADPPASSPGSSLEPPATGPPGMPEVNPGSLPPMPTPEAATAPSPTPTAPPAAPPAAPAQAGPIEPPPEVLPEPERKPEPPRPPIKPPTLERVPAAVAETAPATEPPGPSPAPAPTAEGLGPGWVVVRPGGKKVLGAEASAALAPAPAPSRDGPPAREEAEMADQVEPALHTVQPGENFWSISKLYYRSGRYYKALHAANRNQVPEIRELFVGTVLRIPPPEALDRALIDPPRRASPTDGPAVSQASRRPESTPPDEVILSRPIRPSIPREEVDAPDAPRRPTYQVKANETLRSIARDTLGDNKRYREILDLNRGAIDDPRGPLAAGMTLTLPEDAVIGRRAR